MGNVQGLGEQVEEGVVGFGIHGRGDDFDFEFAAQNRAELVFGGAWLDLDGQEHRLAFSVQASVQVHEAHFNLQFAICKFQIEGEEEWP